MKKNKKKHVLIMVMISLMCLLFTTGCSACKGFGNNCGKCSQDACVFGCVGCAKCIQCSGCTEGFISGCTDIN